MECHVGVPQCSLLNSKMTMLCHQRLSLNTGFSDHLAKASLLYLQFSVPARNISYYFGMCYDSLFSEYPVLPGMKQIGIQAQHAAAKEASKQTGSTEIVLHSP